MWQWLSSLFVARPAREFEYEIPVASPSRPLLPTVADYGYGRLYETQPSVRICVDFLARNVAQLGLHLYRRLDDDSRIRVRDHPINALLSSPNPGTTRFTLVEQLIVDLCVYGNAFWYVTDTSPARLVWMPANRVAVIGVSRPQGYALITETDPQPLDLARMVHVRYANPELPAVGLSPLASLKTRLTEESAMDAYRIHFWRNYARLGGVIERPIAAPQLDARAAEHVYRAVEGGL